MTLAPLSLLRRAVAPAIAAAAVLVVWQLLIWILKVQTFVLPAPTDVAAALAAEWRTILSAAVVTVKAILLGLTLGVTSGVLAALVVARFRSIAQPLLAVAVVVNCAPIVALAPILNNWLGVTSLMSKAGVAAVMVFFPVLVNTTRGLLAVAPLHLELMDSLAANPRQVSTLLRLPTALPYLFSAAKLGATLSVIGVVVSEYFGGPTNALGVYIAHQAALPRFPEAWAGIAVASTVGLGLYGAVTLLERVVMPWHAAARTVES